MSTGYYGLRDGFIDSLDQLKDLSLADGVVAIFQSARAEPG
ncbi:MAG: hypothetical protein R3E11_10815 [Sphingobium sp.]